MGELGTASKIVMVLGVVLLLSNLLTGASLSEWNNLRNTLEQGIDWPTFDDPFDEPVQLSSYSFRPANLIHGVPPNAPQTVDFTGCSVIWICLRDFNGTDDNVSYVTLWRSPFGQEPPGVCAGAPDNCVDASFDLEISALPGQTFKAGVAEIWCRTRNSAVPIDIFIDAIVQWNTGAGAYQSITAGSVNIAKCPVGSFQKISILIAADEIVGDSSVQNERLTMTVEFWVNGVDDVPVDISTVRLVSTYQFAEAGCTAGDFFANLGCQIGQFFEGFINGIIWVVNGIVFVGQVIFAAASFVGRIGLAAGQAIFASFAAIFNLGAPSPVQEIIDIAVIGMLVFLAFLFVMIIRGTGPV